MNRNFRDKELHKVALNGYINTSSDINKSMLYYFNFCVIVSTISILFNILIVW